MQEPDPPPESVTPETAGCACCAPSVTVKLALLAVYPVCWMLGVPGSPCASNSTVPSPVRPCASRTVKPT
ncbi:hypothetical protein BMH30_12695, partial [Leucobacter sp. OLES1]